MKYVWGQAFNHEQHIKRAVSATSLYLRLEYEKRSSITRNYVHNNLSAGDKKFKNTTDLKLSLFDSKPLVYDNFRFFGTHITTVEPNVFLLHQEHYIESLYTLPIDADVITFHWAQVLSWVLHCKPEYACVENKSTQATEITLQKITYWIIAEPFVVPKIIKRGLIYQHLDRGTLQLRLYVDSSLGSSNDMGLKLGYLVLVWNDSSSGHTIDFAITH